MKTNFIFLLLLFAGLVPGSIWAKDFVVPAHVVILQYHHVSTSTPPSTSVSPERFKEHLALLHKEGYQVWPLPHVIEAIREQRPISDKVVSITFDDGYRSVYDTAWPLLKRYHYPFTVFVASQAVDQHQALVMTWKQIKALADSGVTIANHSNTHDHLARRRQGETEADWQQRVTADIARAEGEIRAHTGQSEKLFAYPYGEYTDALKSLVAKAGYVAFGQQSGPVGEHSDFQALPRFPASGPYADPKTLAVKLATLPLPATDISHSSNPVAADEKPVWMFSLPAKLVGRNKLTCYASGQGRIPAVASQKREAVEYRVKAMAPFPSGRARYNCTLPAINGRYYWFSEPWIILNQQGDWQLD